MNDLYSSMNENQIGSGGSSKELDVLWALKEETREEKKHITELKRSTGLARDTIRKNTEKMSSKGLVNISSASDQDHTYLQITKEGLDQLQKVEWIRGESEVSEDWKDQKVRMMVMSQLKHEMEAKYGYEMLRPVNYEHERLVQLGWEELNEERKREQLDKMEFGELTENISKDDIHERVVKIDITNGEGYLKRREISLMIPEPYNKRFSGKRDDNYVIFRERKSIEDTSRDPTLLDILMVHIGYIVPWTDGMRTL